MGIVRDHRKGLYNLLFQVAHTKLKYASTYVLTLFFNEPDFVTAESEICEWLTISQS